MSVSAQSVGRYDIYSTLVTPVSWVVVGGHDDGRKAKPSWLMTSSHSATPPHWLLQLGMRLSVNFTIVGGFSWPTDWAGLDWVHYSKAAKKIWKNCVNAFKARLFGCTKQLKLTLRPSWLALETDHKWIKFLYKLFFFFHYSIIVLFVVLPVMVK